MYPCPMSPYTEVIERWKRNGRPQVPLGPAAPNGELPFSTFILHSFFAHFRHCYHGTPCIAMRDYAVQWVTENCPLD